MLRPGGGGGGSWEEEPWTAANSQPEASGKHQQLHRMLISDEDSRRWWNKVKAIYNHIWTEILKNLYNYKKWPNITLPCKWPLLILQDNPGSHLALLSRWRQLLTKEVHMGFPVRFYGKTQGSFLDNPIACSMLELPLSSDSTQFLNRTSKCFNPPDITQLRYKSYNNS